MSFFRNQTADERHGVAAADPDEGTAPETPRPGPSSRSHRRPWRRAVARVKRSFVWTHRWSSLVLGLALLVVTTSGVPLLYAQEIARAKHADAYAESGGPPRLSFGHALAAAKAHDPSFAPEAVYRAHGVYVAENFETGRRVTVDPASGAILGDFNPNRDGGIVAWTMSLMVNVHECGLTCPEYVGYQSWIDNPIPGTGRLGFDGEPVTVGGFVLGLTGLLLGFLALSGLWLWWPGIKRFADGLRVRWKGGRYARDFDLHQVAGMVALPLLLVWAITGAGYEFGFVEKAWYKVVPGEPAPEQTLESAKSSAPDIGVAAAVAAAQREHGRDEAPTAVDIPAAKEPTATYGVWFADGFDPWRHSDYAGDLLVSVDRRSGDALVTYGGPQSTAQTIWQDWNFPLHAGWAVGPWWRILWLILGLAPLVLAVTGLSTWLYKRGRRKRRRQLATA